MRDAHDGTLVGRYLAWYWDESNYLKLFVKFYIALPFAYLVLMGSTLPLIITNYALGLDITSLYVIGTIGSLIFYPMLLIVPRMFYDIMEVVSSFLYLIVSVFIFFVVIYLGYRVIESARIMST